MKSKRINYSNRWRRGFPYNIVKEPEKENEALVKRAPVKEASREVIPATEPAENETTASQAEDNAAIAQGKNESAVNQGENKAAPVQGKDGPAAAQGGDRPPAAQAGVKALADPVEKANTDIVAPVLLNYEEIAGSIVRAQEMKTTGLSGKNIRKETAKPRNIIEELYNEKFKAPDNPEA